MAVKPVVYDDSTKKHRPLGSGEKMDGLSASSIISSQSGNLITTGSDGLAYATGSGIADPSADNLLEATPSGKLKMDVDRLAEWLDGHPADAKILSEAIKVVSGDSGNVVAAGTDGGAYLSKASLANAIGSMTDAQLQSLASAIADGQTIVASGGKLIVDPTNATAAKLKKITAVLPKDQGGIVADSSTGKLYVDFDAMTPEFKRNLVLSMVDLDGGLAVHGSGAKEGTIYVDFSSIDDDTKRDIVLSMVDLDGGLAVHDSGAKKGTLYVDFENMPTTKFDQLLRQLNMQVPLKQNRVLYVDPNGSNEIFDPPRADGKVRGDAEFPFATVSACVAWAAGYYALGPFNITIMVNYGTYDDHVTLTAYNTSGGTFTIRASDYANPPIIRTSGGVDNSFRCTGGVWNLTRLRVVNYPSSAGLDHTYYVSCCTVPSAGTVNIRGCDFVLSYDGGATNFIHMNVIGAGGAGSVSFSPMAGYSSTISYHKGQAHSLYVLAASNGGSISFQGGYTVNNYVYSVECTGDATYFASVSGSSSMRAAASGDYRIHFVESSEGACTGTPYYIVNGSSALAPVGGFPGAGEGYVEEATYCWYEEQTGQADPPAQSNP